MSSYKVSAEFQLYKHSDGDYDTESQCMIGDHPYLEDFFMFNEDLLDGFLQTDEYKDLPVGYSYWIYISMTISPVYTTHHEYGTELDGWDWEDAQIYSKRVDKLEEGED